MDKYEDIVSRFIGNNNTIPVDGDIKVVIENAQYPASSGVPKPKPLSKQQKMDNLNEGGDKTQDDDVSKLSKVAILKKISDLSRKHGTDVYDQDDYKILYRELKKKTKYDKDIEIEKNNKDDDISKLNTVLEKMEVITKEEKKKKEEEKKKERDSEISDRGSAISDRVSGISDRDSMRSDRVSGISDRVSRRSYRDSGDSVSVGMPQVPFIDTTTKSDSSVSSILNQVGDPKVIIGIIIVLFLIWYSISED